jgi:NAD(P)-dependent dehydrogenase (short-subunit alcohol dehydrogenase family)
MTESVLITGASSGIGLAAVRRFTEAGYRVTATVRKDADEQRLATEFPELTVLNLDLNDETAINETVGGWLERVGGVDVLVNNAGFAQIGPVEELGMEQWRKQMETNFFALVNLSRLVLPFMRERGQGRIINVSSGFGQLVIPIFAPYCVSKFAVEAFTESLRYEVAPFGIGVSMVAPGPVTSNFDQNRQRLPEEAAANSSYARLYANIDQQVKKSHERESSPDDVVDKIMRAATARKPKLRYPVGPMGHAAGLVKFLPKRLLDQVMARFSRN